MENILLPARVFGRLSEVTPAALAALGVLGVVVDIDNTLVPPHTAKPTPAALAFLSRLRGAGIPVLLLSNNNRARVAAFCGGLGIPFLHRAAKPLPGAFLHAARLLELPPRRVAVVGDQIWTDVLGARLCGMTPLLVRPLVTDTGGFFRVKRALERRVLKKTGCDWENLK